MFHVPCFCTRTGNFHDMYIFTRHRIECALTPRLPEQRVLTTPLFDVKS